MPPNLRRLIGCLGIVVAFLGCSPAAMAGDDIPADYDIRLDHAKDAAHLRQAFRAGVGKSARADVARAQRIAADLRALQADLSFVTASPSPHDIAPDVIAPKAGSGRFLTAPRAGGHARTLRDFMQRYPALYGLDAGQIDSLDVVADYTNPDGNLSWVVLRQTLNGVPVFQGEVRAGFTRRGELVRTISSLAPDVAADKAGTAWGDPTDAVAGAAQSLGYSLLPGQIERQAKRRLDDGKVRFQRGPFVDTIEAERFYFPVEAGVLRPAWRVLLWERELAWYVIVDAADGTMLWRKNLTAFQSEPTSFTVYADQSPAPLTPPPTAPDGSQPAGALARETLLPLIQPFNNLGWITDGVNITDGNNVEAGLDVDGANGVDPGSHATGAPYRVFNFAYDPFPGPTLPSDPSFRQGAVANMFFWANVFHDRMYALGFTEQAGNYQNDNFGRGGAAGDRISAEAQDSVGTNNANFAIGADGTRGRYQVMLWTATTPDSDGALDQDLLLHEFTHGVSGRLIGNGAGLTGPHAGGLGEGWSDCAAIFLQARASDDLDAVYPVGEYATGGISPNNHYYGIRRFPYARMSSLGGPMQRPHNPVTFADIDPAQIDLGDGAYPRGPIGSPTANTAHSMAEIWCSALFEIHALLIEKHGFATGNNTMLQLMVDGIKLTPNAPDFLDARDAFIAAAEAAGNNDDAQAWTGFAIRGMGLGASIAGTSVFESFEAPTLQQSPALTFSDAACNGNGVAEPGDRLQLSVPLTNVMNAPITDITLSLNGGPPVAYGTLAPGAFATRQMRIPVPFGHICGTPLPLSFTVNGSAGSMMIAREIAVGESPVAAEENFDSVAPGALPVGWSSAVGGAGAVPWTTAALNAASPPHAAVATLPATSAETMLDSPLLSAPAGASILRFTHQHGFENTFDGGVLEISIAGAPFVDILAAGGSFVAGGYTTTLVAFPGCAATPNPLGVRQAWSGAVPARETVVQLPAAALEQSIQLRWRAGSDCSAASPTGWQIDDVRIEGAPVCMVSTCTLDVFGNGFEAPLP